MITTTEQFLRIYLTLHLLPFSIGPISICMDPEKRYYRSGNTCLTEQQRKAQLARCENAAPKPHPHCSPAACIGRMQQSVKDVRSGRY